MLLGESFAGGRGGGGQEKRAQKETGTNESDGQETSWTSFKHHTTSSASTNRPVAPSVAPQSLDLASILAREDAQRVLQESRDVARCKAVNDHALSMASLHAQTVAAVAHRSQQPRTLRCTHGLSRGLRRWATVTDR